MQPCGCWISFGVNFWVRCASGNVCFNWSRPKKCWESQPKKWKWSYPKERCEVLTLDFTFLVELLPSSILFGKGPVKKFTLYIINNTDIPDSKIIMCICHITTVSLYFYVFSCDCWLNAKCKWQKLVGSCEWEKFDWYLLLRICKKCTFLQWKKNCSVINASTHNANTKLACCTCWILLIAVFHIWGINIKIKAWFIKCVKYEKACDGYNNI